jgi:hypothetical protein
MILKVDANNPKVPVKIQFRGISLGIAYDDHVLGILDAPHPGASVFVGIACETVLPECLRAALEMTRAVFALIRIDRYCPLLRKTQGVWELDVLGPIAFPGYAGFLIVSVVDLNDGDEPPASSASLH